MQTTRIAALVAALVLPVHSKPPENATNAIHCWAFDRSDPLVVRCGDVWAASRIETANQSVRLLKEVDGKLIPFWESKDKTCWKTVKQQLEWAPSKFVPADRDSFVAGNAVRSFEYREDNVGKGTYLLKGVTTPLGVVSDPAGINVLERLLSALDPELQ